MFCCRGESIKVSRIIYKDKMAVEMGLGMGTGMGTGMGMVGWG